MLVNVNTAEEKRKISRMILEDLTEWFGIPESREQYIAESADMTMIAAFEDGRTAGFLCLKVTGKDTMEIAVMGLRKEYHHRGIGTALVREAAKTAHSLGYSFLQVKTVQEGKYPEYDLTNRFYQHCGFKEFEVMPELWGTDNPCQIYVMSLI